MELSPDTLHTMYKRSSILKCLAEGTTEKRRIVANQEVSRSTVDRAFSELEDSGLIDGCGSNYELTLFGVLAFQRYRTLAEQYDNLLKAGPLLTELPADTAITFDLINNADVYKATEGFSSRAIFQFRDHLKDIHKIETTIPVVLPSQIEEINCELQDEDASGELLLERTQVELLRETGSGCIETLQEMDSVSIHVHHDLPSFGITVLDDEEVLVTCPYRG